jgi:SAM-dependent methyltransferase
VEFYDGTFADLVLATQDEAHREATVTFLVERLGLRPGDTVLDQCCGTGRLSLPLARRGLRVLGVDLIPEYVRRARAGAERLGLPCEFHVGDAFDFVSARPCDAAFNWFTSFGYSEEDALNGRMLRRAFESLRPGGRFALDYANVPRLFRELKEHMVVRSRTEAGEALILRETRANVARGMFEQRWTYVLPDGRRLERYGGTRMYLPHELRRMLGEAGFVDVELHGGLLGEAYGLDSPRCILTARRPA